MSPVKDFLFRIDSDILLKLNKKKIAKNCGLS